MHSERTRCGASDKLIAEIDTSGKTIIDVCVPVCMSVCSVVPVRRRALEEELDRWAYANSHGSRQARTVVQAAGSRIGCENACSPPISLVGDRDLAAFDRTDSEIVAVRRRAAPHHMRGRAGGTHKRAGA